MLHQNFFSIYHMVMFILVGSVVAYDKIKVDNDNFNAKKGNYDQEKKQSILGWLLFGVIMIISIIPILYGIILLVDSNNILFRGVTYIILAVFLYLGIRELVLLLFFPRKGFWEKGQIEDFIFIYMLFTFFL